MQFSHPFIFSLFCVFASLREILFCLALFIQNVLTQSRKRSREENSNNSLRSPSGDAVLSSVYFFSFLRLWSLREILFCLALFIQNVLTQTRKRFTRRKLKQLSSIPER